MYGQLERIRLLENRMRNKSHNGVAASLNEESLKSIKSTDSKKIVPQNRLLSERGDRNDDRVSEHLSSIAQPVLLPQSQLQVEDNHKITDYFSIIKPTASSKNTAVAKVLPQPKPDLIKPLDQSPIRQEDAKHPSQSKILSSEFQALRQENAKLKQSLQLRDILTASLKQDILRMTIEGHKSRRSQLRLRINTNKIRLGEYHADKKGRQMWVDGIEIKEIKAKIQLIVREKEQIEKNKKSGKKIVRELNEDPEDWKNAIISHSYFLSREQSALQECLRRLQEEKSMHIRECKMWFEEEHSKYGRTCHEGWKKISKYQLLGLIGKGGFSEVYKAFDTEEMKEVACKVHELPAGWEKNARENYARHANRENHVQKQLKHPNIVRLLDAVKIDPSSFCTILEFCEGPDLACYLKKHKKLPEKEAKIIIRQVIQAIKYLHELPDKVIHYDLKPQNILFHKGRIKITDFGLCKTTCQEFTQLTSQGVGTYWYLPPECFEMEKVMITTKVDIWSIGVVYFEMLYGEKPFGNQMSQIRILQEGIMLKANNVNFPTSQKVFVSNESKQFIRDCLQFKPEARVDIQTAFAHKMFEKK